LKNRRKNERQETDLLGSLVKHLGLGGQSIGSIDQIIQLFTTLQNALDSLMLNTTTTKRNKFNQHSPKEKRMGKRTSTILVSSNSA
jgi:hypothetical protein